MAPQPKKRGPQADPELAPLPERVKNAQKKYYHKKEESKEHPQSWYIQRRRVFDRIKASGKLPQPRTIAKYGIVIENNRVIVPDDLYKPRVVVTWVQEREGAIINARMEQTPTIVKKAIQGTITSDVSNQYLDENYNLGTNADSEIRKAKDSWVAKYRGLGKWLKKIGVLKDTQTGDMASALNDYGKIIDYIKNMKVSKGDNEGAPVLAGTKNEKIKIILLHLDENPGLKNQVSNEAYKAYRGFAQDVQGLTQERTSQARELKSVYKWPEVMDAIEAKWGKYSRENLFFRVYNECPVRNELKNIPFKEDAKNLEKDNHVEVKSPTDITIHINDFKTAQGIKAQTYKLSPEVCDIFTRNMAERDQTDKNELRSPFPFPFENESSLWVWAGKAIAEAGFTRYPYGLSKSSSLDETQNGARHAIATWRNSNFNKLDRKNPEPFGAELAAKMLHTLSTSESTYRNFGFLDSPLQRPALKPPTARTRRQAKNT